MALSQDILNMGLANRNPLDISDPNLMNFSNLARSRADANTIAASGGGLAGILGGTEAMPAEESAEATPGYETWASPEEKEPSLLKKIGRGLADRKLGTNFYAEAQERIRKQQLDMYHDMAKALPFFKNNNLKGFRDFMEKRIEKVVARGGTPGESTVIAAQATPENFQQLGVLAKAKVREGMRAGLLPKDDPKLRKAADFTTVEKGVTPTPEMKNYAAASGLKAGTPEFQKGFDQFLNKATTSASTEHLPGGYTKYMDNQSNVVLEGPGGKLIPEGEARIKAFKEIAKIKRDENKAKVLDTAAAKSNIARSDKAFDQIELIRGGLKNITSAIKAIDEGADSGFIENKFPSITTSSQRLQNIGRRMGLDVVGETTFGALSKGELDLALTTALPDLQEDELKVWLQERKAAQQKLLNYYEDAALHFASGLGTAEWITQQRELRGGAANATDAELMEIAQ